MDANLFVWLKLNIEKDEQFDLFVYWRAVELEKRVSKTCLLLPTACTYEPPRDHALNVEPVSTLRSYCTLLKLCRVPYHIYLRGRALFIFVCELWRAKTVEVAFHLISHCRTVVVLLAAKGDKMQAHLPCKVYLSQRC